MWSYIHIMWPHSFCKARSIQVISVVSGGVKMNITPLSAMNSDFAKKVTGGEDLSDEQKKQIQYQQQVGIKTF